LIRNGPVYVRAGPGGAKERIMALYWTKIKYRFGSGKATTSTEVGTSQFKGKSESAVMEFLREKHKSKKTLKSSLKRLTGKVNQGPKMKSSVYSSWMVLPVG
jgi:hypothetical protein